MSGVGRRGALIIAIILPILVVAAILGYEFLQRAAIRNCQFKIERVEVLANFPVEGMLQEVVPPLLLSTILGPAGPLESIVEMVLPISSNINLEHIAQEFIEQTTLSFDFYIRVTNPSYIAVKIDRADIRITVNDLSLGTVQIPNSYEIPSGASQLVEVTGLKATLADLASTALKILQDDFLVNVRLDLTSHMKTLLSLIDIEGTLTASFRLIPKPPTVIASLDSMAGTCQIDLQNRDSVPMEGSAIVYILQDPKLPTNVGLINWLRPRVEQIQKWEMPVALQPGEDKMLQMSGISLKPNSHNVAVVLWNPRFDLIPYQLSAQFGPFQTSSDGTFPLQMLQTTRMVVYLLTHDFGYLGQHQILPFVTVSDVCWLDSNGNRISEASIGDIITGSVRLSTEMSGTLRLSVRKDMAYATDIGWQTSSFQVTESSYQATISFQVDTSERYGSGMQECRGYFLKVELNGFPIYEMESSYPPRLRVSIGQPLVQDAYWVVGGQRSRSANAGDAVETNVVVKAEGGSVIGTLTIKVRKDMALSPDIDYAQRSFSVSLKEDEYVRLYFSWTPDEASEGFLRGYHVEVLFNGRSIWTMGDTYPPRLAVSKAAPTQGSLKVTSAYWVAGGQPVTSVEASGAVEAHVVCTAQGGPVAGSLLIKVKKDISYAPDTEYAEQAFHVDLETGASNDFHFSWIPDEPSAGSLRGYFIEVWFDGQKVQTMDSSYPPRLRATLTSQGVPEVSDAYWMVGSARVTTAKVGDKVEAHVTIRAVGVPLEGYVTVRIRKDIVLLPDTDFLVQTFQISVRSGEETDISLTFYPDELSGGSLRGYFMEVVLTTWNKEWTMESIYPPRLKVS